MPDPLANPFWHALTTEHASVALGSGLALRYPADVIPFGAVAEPTPAALTALRDLLQPGEILYVTGDALPAVEGLTSPGKITGWQMHFPSVHLDALSTEQHRGERIDFLGEADAPAMVALTDVAFPGFFRPRTYVLGNYFGIRLNGELIAMAGERICTPTHREISAVCTHPAHTGKGYAALLIQHLLQLHAASGLNSFLHVAGSNARAIGLYQHLGFTKSRAISFNQLRRED